MSGLSSSGTFSSDSSLQPERKIFWMFLILILCFDQNEEMNQRSYLTLMLLGEIAQYNFESETALTISFAFSG